jgi:hypothetical protein
MKTVKILQQKDYEKVMDTYEELFPVAKTTLAERSKIRRKVGEDLKTFKAFLLIHSDLFLQKLLTFNFSTLEAYTGGLINIEKIKDIFQQISLKFGALAGYDAEHFLLNNPVHEKPFIQTSDDTVFSSLWSVMSHLSLGLLENFCSQDEKLRRKYNDARAGYLEDQIAMLFKASFPMAQIYTGSIKR